MQQATRPAAEPVGATAPLATPPEAAVRRGGPDAYPGPSAGYARVARVAGLAAAGLGAIGLVGWASGIQVLGSVRVGYIQMAPSTGLCLLVLGLALYAHSRAPASRRVRACALGAIGLVALILVGKLVAWLTDVPLGFEELLIRHPEAFGRVRRGRMSPITAGCFAATGLALLLLVAGPGSRGAQPGAPRGRQAAAGLASLAILTMAVVTLGYIYGSPMLYGASVIPVALPTAVAFLCLGGGLLAWAGPEHLPLRPFAAPTARSLLLRTFLPVTVGAVVLSGAAYHFLRQQVTVNQGLLAALLGLISAGVVSLAVSQTAQVIGGRIDRSEEELRRMGAQLEDRVEERTAALAATAAELQADVSERRRAEQALRASEERYALALRGANEGLWDWDLDSGDIYFSARYKQMLGYEEHELPNDYEGWRERLHPDEREWALGRLIDHLKGKAVFDIEHRLRHRDGTWRWVRARGVSVPGADGRAARMAGSFTDITEEKEAEQRQTAQYALTRAIGEAVGLSDALPKILQAVAQGADAEAAVYWHVDPDDDDLAFSDVWQAPTAPPNLGPRLAEPGCPVCGGLPAAVLRTRRPAWVGDLCQANGVEAAWAGDTGVHGALAVPVLGDEVMGVVELFSQDVLEPDEDLLDMLASMGSEIGQFVEHERTAEALRDSELLYHSLVENLPLSIFRKDVEGRFTFANPPVAAPAEPNARRGHRQDRRRPGRRGRRRRTPGGRPPDHADGRDARFGGRDPPARRRHPVPAGEEDRALRRARPGDRRSRASAWTSPPGTVPRRRCSRPRTPPRPPTGPRASSWPT